MNELQIFNNDAFGSIRTLNIDNQIWFVGKDVAKILGYDQTSNMVKRIDQEDFISSKLDGMNMKSIIINESGLYASILGSKLPNAKQFKRWVTNEVLPSLRENGSYQIVEEPEHPYETISSGNLYLEAAKLIAGCRLEKALPYLIETLKPIVDFSEVKEVASKLISTSSTKDSVDSFLEGKTESEIINQQSKDIYNKYKVYAIQNGLDEMNLANFSKAINAKLGTTVKRRRVKGQLTGFFMKGRVV